MPATLPATVKVGVLNDTADLLGADGEAGDDLTLWLEREVAAMRAAGRLETEVEFVHAYALGFPSGTAEAVERAYRHLADQNVALIVGPAIGDNALVAVPLSEQLRLPTINSGAADGARGRYMFHHQAGSARDEAAIIIAHLTAGAVGEGANPSEAAGESGGPPAGCRRLGVVYDQSPPGMRQLSALRDEAAARTLEIFAQGISPHADDSSKAIAALLAEAPDAVVHLGFGPTAPIVATALAETGWSGPRMMNGAGLSGRDEPALARAFEGWFYIDRLSDGNTALGALRARSAAPACEPGSTASHLQVLAAARGHDLGRLVAEGLARASDLTREGVRAGLEQVRAIPAAQGCEGTVLGFDAKGRAALHGRYLVVRQWRDGETCEVGRTDAAPIAVGAPPR